jgi:hypothetical protein
MEDFVSHKLAIGDIVYWSYKFVRYYGKIHDFRPTGVYTITLGANPAIITNHKIWAPDSLWWFSSDYADVPDTYIAEILSIRDGVIVKP